MSKHYWISVIKGERGGEAHVMQLLPDRLVWASTTIKGMQNVIDRLRAGGDADFKRPETLMRSEIMSVEYEENWTAIAVRQGREEARSVRLRRQVRNRPHGAGTGRVARLFDDAGLTSSIAIGVQLGSGCFRGDCHRDDLAAFLRCRALLTTAPSGMEKPVL